MMDPVRHLAPETKGLVDVSATAIWLGALTDHLPAIAAGLSALWTLIRLYETATVQKWLGRVPPSQPKGADDASKTD